MRIGLRIACLLLFAFTCRHASGQEPRGSTPIGMSGTVRGTVVDARTLQPLVDVAVELDREDRTVHTGVDGRFEWSGLAPGTHGLYLSIVGYILIKRDIVVRGGETIDITIPLTAGTGTYSEEVRVTPPELSRMPPVPGRQTLRSAELQNLRGVLTDDPMRAVQALPGVAANDDLRAEVAVRGSDFRHVGVLIDGVESHALMHAVRGTQDGGSIAMINSDVLEDVTLFAGSYPQRFGNRTGAEIGFTMRTGSRDRRQTRASVSGTSASIVSEGPVGTSRRGSWLVSARKSYLDLIINAMFGRSDFDLGFVDTQSKIAYDVSPRQRLEAVFIAGRSNLHDNPATAASTTVVDGIADAGLATISWISTPSPRVVVTQRVSAERSRFKNDNRSGLALAENDRDSYGYRLEVLHVASPRVSYEAAVQAQRLTENARVRRPNATAFSVREAYDASAAMYSALARTSRSVGSRWMLESGARVDHTTLTRETVASPWAGLRWSGPRDLVLSIGTGLYHQFPEFDQVTGVRGGVDVSSERAVHADAGVEQRLGAGLSWTAVFFGREERNFIRLPDAESRLVAGRVRVDAQSGRYENRVDGRSRGFELSLRREKSDGLSGWLSYSYAATRQHDRVTNEFFRADFDQRHTFNAYAYERLTSRLGIAAKVRAGSGTPVIGYFERRNSNVFLSERRNSLELPRYLRVDLRANQVFNWKRSRLTLFAEVINVLNRKNMRQSGVSINRITGLVTGAFDTMAPIVPSMGILVEF